MAVNIVLVHFSSMYLLFQLILSSHYLGSKLETPYSIRFLKYFQDIWSKYLINKFV